MDYDIISDKRIEIIDLLDKLDNNECLSSITAKDLFVTKYIFLDIDDNIDYESVATLHINNEHVKSTKIGNIIFNFKESFWDAVKSVMGIERNLLTIQESESVRLEKRILLILEVIHNIYQLCEVKLDADTAKIVIKLFELDATQVPVEEEVLREKMNYITNLNERLNTLYRLKCIDILDGKISIKESVKGDWLR